MIPCTLLCKFTASFVMKHSAHLIIKIEGGSFSLYLVRWFIMVLVRIADLGVKQKTSCLISGQSVKPEKPYHF